MARIVRNQAMANRCRSPTMAMEILRAPTQCRIILYLLDRNHKDTNLIPENTIQFLAKVHLIQAQRDECHLDRRPVGTIVLHLNACILPSLCNLNNPNISQNLMLTTTTFTWAEVQILIGRRVFSSTISMMTTLRKTSSPEIQLHLWRVVQIVMVEPVQIACHLVNR